MADLPVLVTGANGQLGCELRKRVAGRGILLISTDRDELDITECSAVRGFLAGNPVAAVINAAAYTAVDKAETEPDLARRVNRDACEILAQSCSKARIPLIHVSTDFVFDGAKGLPYVESDVPNPLGVYARTKLEGEQAIQSVLDQHLILRTSWLFSCHGANFVKTILRLAREKEELKVIDDQHGCPTFAGDLADAILSLVERFRTTGSLPWGLYHCCGDGITSWNGFAREILVQASAFEELKARRVVKIPTSEYPLPARRPSFSALDCTLFQNTFAMTIRPWIDGLEDMMKELYS